MDIEFKAKSNSLDITIRGNTVLVLSFIDHIKTDLADIEASESIFIDRTKGGK